MNSTHRFIEHFCKREIEQLLIEFGRTKLLQEISVEFANLRLSTDKSILRLKWIGRSKIMLPHKFIYSCELDPQLSNNNLSYHCYFFVTDLIAYLNRDNKDTTGFISILTKEKEQEIVRKLNSFPEIHYIDGTIYTDPTTFIGTKDEIKEIPWAIKGDPYDHRKDPLGIDLLPEEEVLNLTPQELAALFDQDEQ